MWITSIAENQEEKSVLENLAFLSTLVKVCIYVSALQKLCHRLCICVDMSVSLQIYLCPTLYREEY